MSNITQKWVNLLVPFTNGYDKSFSVSELARLSGIPQQTASRYLESMVKMNLVRYDFVGRNKMIYLELKPAVIELLTSVEIAKTMEFRSRCSTAAVIIDEISAICDAILLFGSYASGHEAKDSDIDVIIFGCRDKSKINRIKSLSPIRLHEHNTTYAEFEKSLQEKNALALEVKSNRLMFGNYSRLVGMFAWISSGGVSGKRKVYH